MTDHEFDATTARLAEIRARADAATEGPWVRGDRKRIAGVTGRFGEDRCVYCKEGTEPSWVGVRDINGTEMLAHVHAASAFTWWDHGIYATRAAATDSICVVRDTDEYGLMYPADAEFIAHARQDIPWLLSEIERLTTESGETVHPRSSAPCTECVEDAARLGAKVEHLKDRVERLDPIRFESMDDFLDRLWGDEVVIRDGSSRLWLAWETQDGDWLASRPRAEDDYAHSADDPWRPVGPEPIERLPLPWLVSQPGYAPTEVGVPPDMVQEYLDRLKGMSPSPRLSKQIAELESAHHAKKGGE